MVEITTGFELSFRALLQLELISWYIFVAWPRTTQNFLLSVQKVQNGGDIRDDPKEKFAITNSNMHQIKSIATNRLIYIMKIMEKHFFEKIQNGRQINNGVAH
jgi:hypothetical protein